MDDFVKFEQDAGVVTLTLNRPDERNALSTKEQWDELVACCDRSAMCLGYAFDDCKSETNTAVAARTASVSAGKGVKCLFDECGGKAGTCIGN